MDALSKTGPLGRPQPPVAAPIQAPGTPEPGCDPVAPPAPPAIVPDAQLMSSGDPYADPEDVPPIGMSGTRPSQTGPSGPGRQKPTGA